MFKKTLLVLPLLLAFSMSCFAGNYECPSPDKIAVFNLIEDQNVSWALIMGPAMSTSKGFSIPGMAIGISTDKVDPSIPPFLASNSETIDVNGVPTPGYSCEYYKVGTTPMTQELRDQINRLPQPFRRNAQKLAQQGFSFSYAAVAYILK